MSRRLPEQPSGMYRFENTPRGRRPLVGNQVARANLLEQARVRTQLLWSLPLAALIASAALFAGTLASASLTIYTAQALALAGMLPAAMHLSRWSRLQAQSGSSTS